MAGSWLTVALCVIATIFCPAESKSSTINRLEKNRIRPGDPIRKRCQVSRFGCSKKRKKEVTLGEKDTAEGRGNRVGAKIQDVDGEDRPRPLFPGQKVKMTNN